MLRVAGSDCGVSSGGKKAIVKGYIKSPPDILLDAFFFHFHAHAMGQCIFQKHPVWMKEKKNPFIYNKGGWKLVWCNLCT